MHNEDNFLSLMRFINEDDYSKGYVDLFSTLSTCPPLSQEDFKDVIKERSTQGWMTWVLENREEGNSDLIATTSLLLERKIYREGQRVGHIEDVIVLPKYQHLKIGMHLVQFAMQKAKEMGCYKVILDCKQNLENFYAKSGLEISNIQMGTYFKK